MADVTDANAGAEPSMEEILASIRRIIADEKEPQAPETPAPAAGGDDVLELTQMVQDDGSIVDVTEAAPPVEIMPTPVEAAPPPPPPPSPSVPMPEPPAFDKIEELVSDSVASAATSSLASLANTVQIERRASLPAATLLGNGGRTLEDMVLELMKPMLKAWLDEHLPPIVDRIVQREVERIARRVQE